MADDKELIVQQFPRPIKVLKWKVSVGQTLAIGRIILLYDYEGASAPEHRKLKSQRAGTVHELLAPEGSIVKTGESLLQLRACIHPTVMKDMCAECGADLRIQDIVTTASVPMVHSIPDLKVSEELAQKLGKADGDRLLRDRKLVLLVDLDQTLIHTTNDNIPPNIKDVYHFQLYGPNSPWYHTRLRPGTHAFLKNIATLFELHICTFGARNYAHTITMFLDNDETFFSNRILSRDECFDPTSKKANLKALFPCGDNMVCIIDDREDVWNYALNLIHVKPYHFFQHTGDINAPPGLDKQENDEKDSGVDLSKVKVQKPNGKNVKVQENGVEDDRPPTKISESQKLEDSSNDVEIKHEINLISDKTEFSDNSGEVKSDVRLNKSDDNNKMTVENDAESKTRGERTKLTVETNESKIENNVESQMIVETGVETKTSVVNDVNSKMRVENNMKSQTTLETGLETKKSFVNDAKSNMTVESNVERQMTVESSLETKISLVNDAKSSVEGSIERQMTVESGLETKMSFVNDAKSTVEGNVEGQMTVESGLETETSIVNDFGVKTPTDIETKMEIDDDNKQSNKVQIDVKSNCNEHVKLDLTEKDFSPETDVDEVESQVESDAQSKVRFEKSEVKKVTENKVTVESAKVTVANEVQAKVKSINEVKSKANVQSKVQTKERLENELETTLEVEKIVRKENDANGESEKLKASVNLTGEVVYKTSEVDIEMKVEADEITTETNIDSIESDNKEDKRVKLTSDESLKSTVASIKVHCDEVKVKAVASKDALVEIEDPDDYLLHLEDILKRIHKTFYEEYDKMESGEVPDLKQVIPNVRHKILNGTKLVFSGLVPTHIKLEQSKAYLVAKSLGADVSQDLDPDATHLVAVRPGTAKVNAGRRKKNLKIVTPDWLWACAERWEHVEELIYPLNAKGSKNRHPPPHCSSPEHVPAYPIHDTPGVRKRTPSGRFMDTINPLMSFSVDDIADMDKEVEDILDDESDESEVENDKCQPINEESQETPAKKEDTSSDESLTEEYPRGFKRNRDRMKLDEAEGTEGVSLNDDVTESLDDYPSAKFRRGEQLGSEFDFGQESNSEGSVDAPDETDDGEWNMMGAALEREFLSNN